MSNVFRFEDVARLPARDDNVAIVTQRLEAGSEIVHGDQHYVLSHTMLEGHRFAIAPIAAGEALLSWGLPFGYARHAIDPGDYVANEAMLEALSGRSIDFALPTSPNFEDDIEPYAFDEAAWQPVDQVPLYTEPRTFLGYRRADGRGVGTRNYIVLLGTTSRTGSLKNGLSRWPRHTKMWTVWWPSRIPKGVATNPITLICCCARWQVSWSTPMSVRYSRSILASNR